MVGGIALQRRWELISKCVLPTYEIHSQNTQDKVMKHN